MHELCVLHKFLRTVSKEVFMYNCLSINHYWIDKISQLLINLSIFGNTICNLTHTRTHTHTHTHTHVHTHTLSNHRTHTSYLSPQRSLTQSELTSLNLGAGARAHGTVHYSKTNVARWKRVTARPLVYWLNKARHRLAYQHRPGIYTRPHHWYSSPPSRWHCHLSRMSRCARAYVCTCAHVCLYAPLTGVGKKKEICSVVIWRHNSASVSRFFSSQFFVSHLLFLPQPLNTTRPLPYFILEGCTSAPFSMWSKWSQTEVHHVRLEDWLSPRVSGSCWSKLQRFVYLFSSCVVVNKWTQLHLHDIFLTKTYF